MHCTSPLTLSLGWVTTHCLYFSTHEFEFEWLIATNVGHL
jgi:hypothetical protein